MENDSPGFFAIIPSYVRYCKNIEPAAKLFYGELTALARREGYCWASNKYFAELYGVTERTITNWLESLQRENFIVVETTKIGMRWDRKIWISQEMFTKVKKVRDRSEENFETDQKKTSTDKENSEDKKKQQLIRGGVAVSFSESPHEEKKNPDKRTDPKISLLLKEDSITEQAKIEMSRDFSEEDIRYGIAFVNASKDVQSREALMRWAARKKPPMPKKPEDIESENKAYAMKYDNMQNATSKVYACNAYVEVSNYGVNGGNFISYKEKGFLEKFKEALIRNNFNLLGTV